MNRQLRSALNEVLVEKYGPGQIEQHRSVSGGCINDCYRFEFAGKPFFVKTNSPGRYPEMFAAELRGLKLLAAANAIKVPESLAAGENWLLLEFLETGSRIDNYWETFGEQLAELHRSTDNSFGLDHSNYIGSLAQYNDRNADWSTFFRQSRIEPQLRMARG